MHVAYNNRNRGFTKPPDTEEQRRHLASEISSAERMIKYYTSTKIKFEEELDKLQNDNKEVFKGDLVSIPDVPNRSPVEGGGKEATDDKGGQVVDDGSERIRTKRR